MTADDGSKSVPSHQRCVPGSVNIPIAKFPSTASLPSNLDATQAVTEVVDSFNKALAAQDFGAIAKLFADGDYSYWRDHLALTWKFRTVQSRPRVQEFLESSAKSKDGLRLKKIELDLSSPAKKPATGAIDAAGDVTAIMFYITLDTVLGTGAGYVRLVHQDDGWKIYTLYTRLQGIKGHEEGSGGRRPPGVQHGGQPGRKNWAERREAETNHEDGLEPVVLIVGMSHPLCSYTYLGIQEIHIQD